MTIALLLLAALVALAVARWAKRAPASAAVAEE